VKSAEFIEDEAEDVADSDDEMRSVRSTTGCVSSVRATQLTLPYFILFFFYCMASSRSRPAISRAKSVVPMSDDDTANLKRYFMVLNYGLS
jgi:hypothetical protein